MEFFITNSSEETQKLASEFARSILANKNSLENFQQGVSLQSRVLALYGDLGSGKTTFVQGMAKGLGVKKRIISPTFVIVRNYKIRDKIYDLRFTNLYHIDLYRMEDDKDIEGLGLGEIIDSPENIVAIEWAEKMGRLLPKERIDIKFEYVGEKGRKIIIGTI